MDNKIFKGKVYHLKCGYSMCYIGNSNRMLCSDYNRRGTKSPCCRFTVSNNDIKELLLLHDISYENVDKIYIDERHNYKIIKKDGTISSFDGSTIIV